MNGASAIITVSNTSPAKIFPKSRKEKLTIFENSLTISSSPTKKWMGFEKFKDGGYARDNTVTARTAFGRAYCAVVIVVAFN